MFLFPKDPLSVSPGLQREGIGRDTQQNFLRTGVLNVRKASLAKQIQAWAIRDEQERLPA